MHSPPEGFVWRPLEGGGAWWRQAVAEPLEAAGVAEPWRLVAARPDLPGTGRGPRGVASTAAGRVWIKQCLRGGLPARLNAERYFRLDRFRGELEVGRKAAAAGLPVLDTWGLVFRRARPGWRVWQITPLVELARDLACWFSEPMPGAAAEELLEAVLTLIARVQAAGLHHPDLNLGNFLAQSRPQGGWEVMVIDLDRARWYEGGVPPRLRRRAFERFDRSWRKIFGHAGPVTAQRRRALLESYLGVAPDSA